MAIGFSLGQPMGKLSAQDMGVTDFPTAFARGVEAGNKPAQLSATLLGTHLTNALNRVKAQYAPEQAQAALEYQRALIKKALRGPEEPAEIRTIKWLLANKDQFEHDNNQNPENHEPSAPTVGEGQPSYVSSLTGGQPTTSSSVSQPDYAKSIYKYALNKATRMPNELPHEKMEREITTSNLKEQNKLDIKQAQKLRDTAKDLQLAGLDVEGIHDILTGPDSLGTGITKTLIGKLGWGSEKLGQFNERALRLQTQMTKALSSRGGVGAAKIVQSGKPTTWKSTSENLGITDAYADRIKNEFDLLNQEYKAITGKNLPYTLPEYVHNIGNKMIPTKNINGRTFELKNGKWHERKIRV